MYFDKLIVDKNKIYCFNENATAIFQYKKIDVDYNNSYINKKENTLTLNSIYKKFSVGFNSLKNTVEIKVVNYN